MKYRYLGHLSRSDPLYGYIQGHIAPQLGFYSPDAVYRVFKFTCSRSVYLYEEQLSKVLIVAKFHQNHLPGASFFPRKTGEKGIYLKQQLKDKLVEHKQYINKHGQDMPEIRNWK